MANTIKRGESLFIPFKNGESIYDSQLKPRMYKTKEQYDRFGYHFKDAEMVEYAEVVRCKDCRKCRIYDDVITRQKQYECRLWHGATREVSADSFCDAGERREGE